MLKTASISLALLLALLVGNSAELRIIDAAGAYATPLRSAALRYAAAGSGSVHIEKTNASEALRRLDDGTAELILIAEDQLPETFTGCVWNYCTAKPTAGIDEPPSSSMRLLYLPPPQTVPCEPMRLDTISKTVPV